MFKEAFISEMSKITPTQLTKSQVLDSMHLLKAEKERSKVKKTGSNRLIVATAIALCVIIIGGIFFIKNPFGGSSGIIAFLGGESNINDNTVNFPTIERQEGIPAQISHKQIYDLFNSIYLTEHKEEFLVGNSTKGSFDLFDGFGTDKLEYTEEIIEDEYAEEGDTAMPEEDVGSATKTDNETYDAGEDYSATNTQVENVDEADIVKTDGKFIYTLDADTNTVFVAKADKGELENVSHIDISVNLEKEEYYSANIIDMYLAKDRLIIIGDRQDYNFNMHTAVKIYDISNPYTPAFLGEYTQSGSHISTRLTDGILYLFTNRTYYDAPDKNDVSTYVPLVAEGESDPCPINEKDIYVFDGEVDRSYLIVSSLDVAKGTSIDSAAALGGGDTIYANTESLYVAARDSSFSYLEDNKLVKKYEDTTRLLSFGIDKGNITPRAEGYVRGSILNQFSMDEYNEHFRIVTTVYGSITDTSDSGAFVSSSTYQTNALFVLDRSLKQVGSITNLAPDERVYSVRFMGNTGYFVTFRQIDPLFAVDLSDPTNPTVMSQLKIPGFSNYLHPWGEGLLLGIGADADENTGVTGGIKLSMFDISDPTAVYEKHKILSSYESSSVGTNHKAILVSVNKNLIGFVAKGVYHLYSYDKDKGFILKGEIELPTLQLPNSEGYHYFESNTRGIYIGDYLYICHNKFIVSYKLNTLELVDRIDY